MNKKTASDRPPAADKTAPRPGASRVLGFLKKAKLPPAASITAVTVAFMGLLGNDALKQHDQANLYAQLIAQREQSASELRKDMFQNMMTMFFQQRLDANSEKDWTENEWTEFFSKRLLQLEMLALNFGEVMTMGPLFHELSGEIRLAHEKGRIRNEADHLDRLHTLAKRVSAWQLAALPRANVAKYSIEWSRTGSNSPLDFRWPSVSCGQKVEFRSIRVKPGLPGLETEPNWDPIRVAVPKFGSIQAAEPQLGSIKEMLKGGSLDAPAEPSVKRSEEDPIPSSRREPSEVKTAGHSDDESWLTSWLPWGAGQEDAKRGPRKAAGDSAKVLAPDCAAVSPSSPKCRQCRSSFGDVTRFLWVDFSNADPERGAVTATVGIKAGFNDKAERVTFNLDFFDFPMIDSVRLSEDHRLALVLRALEKDHLKATLVLFPGMYGSQRDKPFLDVVMQQLPEITDAR